MIITINMHSYWFWCDIKDTKWPLPVYDTKFLRSALMKNYQIGIGQQNKEYLFVKK